MLTKKIWVKKDSSSCFYIILLVDVEGTRGGSIEVRPSVREVVGRNWRTVNESSTTDGGLSLRAVAKVGVAENTHGSSQGDINDIISRTSSIRKTSGIVTNDSQEALAGLSGGGDGRVQAEIFNKSSIRGNRELIDSFDSSQVNGLEIRSRIVRRGQGWEVCLEDGVDRSEEERGDYGGERGEGNVSVEETILRGLASAPFILVGESNEKFIDERISQARLLSVSLDGSSGSPTTNDTITSSSDTLGGDLKDK